MTPFSAAINYLRGSYGLMSASEYLRERSGIEAAIRVLEAAGNVDGPDFMAWLNFNMDPILQGLDTYERIISFLSSPTPTPTKRRRSEMKEWAAYLACLAAGVVIWELIWMWIHRKRKP